MIHQSESLNKFSQQDLQLRCNFQVTFSQSFVSDIGCNNLDEISSTRAIFDNGKNSSTDNLTKSLTEIFPTMSSVFTQRIYSLCQRITPSQLSLAVLLHSTPVSQGVSLKPKA